MRCLYIKLEASDFFVPRFYNIKKKNNGKDIFTKKSYRFLIRISQALEKIHKHFFITLKHFLRMMSDFFVPHFWHINY